MPEKIGKYTLERMLGQGGFGKVYLAFDSDVGQPVAIKRLIAQGDPDLLTRFQLEIRTTASLRHKNIVTILASGEEAGDPYVVMEFLEGLTLKEIIQGSSRLSLLDKIRVMSQVAEGLAYAHSKGVVHRDVKPENIMLLPSDTVKIMDFGIALRANRSTSVTQTGGIVGTPSYFAPEQLQGFKANEQTDIFSFGDVFYELLSGLHPFEEYKGDFRSLQIAIVSYEPKPLSELVPGCPAALETLVHRTLAKEPEFRYRKFEEIQLDCEAIMADLKHEGAAAIMSQVAALAALGDLKSALSQINHAYQLDPGNREVRRLREEINLCHQKEEIDWRIGQLLSSAEQQVRERRYAEAVQTLESGAKLDTSNSVIAERLEDARRKLESYLRANRLVAEARSQEQKGFLNEAEDRLLAALEVDPRHTEALRLSRRVRAEIERRRDEKRREIVREAQQHLAAGRFGKARELADALETVQAGSEVDELRRQIDQKEAEERWRQRADRFNLAILKTRETIDTGDFPLVRRMLEHIETNFLDEPGAARALRDLRERLDIAHAAWEIGEYAKRARGFLAADRFGDALDLLKEAGAKYPAEARLRDLVARAEEDLRVRARSEAIGAAIAEASARRADGDPHAALEVLAKAMREFADDEPLANLARNIAGEIASRESIRQQIASGDWERAARALEKMQTNFPGAPFGSLAAEIDQGKRYRDALQKTDREREAGNLPAAEELLTDLTSENPLDERAAQMRRMIERERLEAERQRRIARLAVEIRECLSRADLTEAAARLTGARAQYPGESIWDEVQREWDALNEETLWSTLESGLEAHRTEIAQARERFAAMLKEGRAAEAADLIDGEFGNAAVFDDLREQARQAIEEQRQNRTLQPNREDAPPQALLREYPARAGQTGTADSAPETLDARPSRRRPMIWAISAAGLVFAAVGAYYVITPRPGASGSTNIHDEHKTSFSGPAAGVVHTIEPNPIEKDTAPTPVGPEEASLIVDGAVEGATVTVDGREAGTTGRDGRLQTTVAAGRRTISVRKYGYDAPLPQITTLRVGDKQTLTFRLTAKNAVLEVVAGTTGALVRIAGDKTLGAIGADGRLTAQVQVGEHIIEISKERFATRQFSLHFDPGRTVILAASELKPIATSAGATGNTGVVQPPDSRAVAEQAWDKVKDSTDPALLDAFAHDNRDSPHAHEAQVRAQDLRWRAAIQNKDIAALEVLSAQDPGSPHAKEARPLLEEALWASINHQDEAQLQSFISRFPDGQFHNEALRQIQQIRVSSPGRDSASASPNRTKLPTSAGSSVPATTSIARATVCVFEAVNAGYGVSTHVSMDHKYIGTVRRGRYLCFSPEPGPHDFTGRAAQGAMRIDVKPGGTYYLESVSGFRQRLRLDQYESSFTRLKPAESGDLLDGQSIKWVPAPWLVQ